VTLKILKVSVGPTFCGEKHLEMPKLALSFREKQRTALEESQNSITLRLCPAEGQSSSGSNTSGCAEREQSLPHIQESLLEMRIRLHLITKIPSVESHAIAPWVFLLLLATSSYSICPDRIKCAEKQICVYNQSPMPDWFYWFNPEKVTSNVRFIRLN
jgi:hypothetical protein